MKPLYTSEEFEKAKSSTKLPCECRQCSKTFFKVKHEIQKVLNHNERRSGDYCSKQCQNSAQITQIELTCLNCNKIFKKILSQVKKSKKHFCSRSCSTTYNNTHKTHGTRRSKLEQYLEQQLIVLYPNLQFDFNKKDAINSELDIYIPSLKLAFELNGIYHYEPIHGQDKLSQIQNNDHRKFQACAELGISLCIIDVSKMNYFKQNLASNFLKIITNIINNNLNFSNMSKNVLNS